MTIPNYVKRKEKKVLGKFEILLTRFTSCASDVTRTNSNGEEDNNPSLFLGHATGNITACR